MSKKTKVDKAVKKNQKPSKSGKSDGRNGKVSKGAPHSKEVGKNADENVGRKQKVSKGAPDGKEQSPKVGKRVEETVVRVATDDDDKERELPKYVNIHMYIHVQKITTCVSFVSVEGYEASDSPLFR